MSEPVHRLSDRARRSREEYSGADWYATEVLLIADSAGTGGHEGRGGRTGETPAEPLDMESVVRKLIALLSEQQP